MTGKYYQHGEGSSIIVKSFVNSWEEKRILIFINLMLFLILIILQKKWKIMLKVN